MGHIFLTLTSSNLGTFTDLNFDILRSFFSLAKTCFKKSLLIIFGGGTYNYTVALVSLSRVALTTLRKVMNEITFGFELGHDFLRLHILIKISLS